MTFNYFDNVFNNSTLQHRQTQVEHVQSVKEKHAYGREIIGSLVGAGVGLAVPVLDLKDQLCKHELFSPEISYMTDITPDVDTFENTEKNIKEILKNKGLKDKGVELLIYDGTDKKTELIKDVLDKEFHSNKVSQRIKENTLTDLMNRENAYYLSKNKKIVLNRNCLYSSAYHEAGHALNSHSPLGKILLKGRVLTPLGISLVAPVALAVGLLHKVDNTKPKKDKSFKERTLDFIKNNAGKLTLASYIPMLAEEGLASIKGVKLAKEYLDKPKIKQLKKNYLKAWKSYAWSAALVSLAVTVGIGIADDIKKGKNED